MNFMCGKSSIKFFLIAITSLTLVATNLYLPAMPLMVQDFDTTTDMMQYSLSIYLLALSFLSVIYGPLSDAVGRRKIFLIGLSIFFLSSVALIFSTDIYMFLALRFLQGCGAASSLIAPAVVSDLFDNRESSKIISQMSMVIILSLAVPPAIGGYVSAYLGWRVCFIIVAVLVAILWACFYFFFPETRAKETKVDIRISDIFNNYKRAIQHPSFMAYVVINSMPACVLWCLLTLLPFVFIAEMEVETQNYGYYMAVLIATFSVTSYVSQKVIMRTGITKLMRYGIGLMYISAVILFLSSFLSPYSAMWATLCLIPFMMSIPNITPPSISKALSYVRDISGTGAATIAVSRQSFAFLGTIAAGFFSDKTLYPAALFMGAIATIILLTYLLAMKVEKNKRELEFNGQGPQESRSAAYPSKRY